MSDNKVEMSILDALKWVLLSIENDNVPSAVNMLKSLIQQLETEETRKNEDNHF